ncbi:MAG: PAS domain-containing sensor histidine kinase [Oscillatoriales cyanobacterium C42_A2020_001]|nr:PAS domain-containing sensor histidine kinase [Leptolyngbyaceae cyanobacterium C42_A2020_001]
MDVRFLLGLLTGVAIAIWCHYQTSKSTDLSPTWLDRVFSPFTRPARMAKAIALQKRVSQELHDELEALQQLFQVAPVGFLKVDEENQLISCNARACELLSLEPREPQKPRLLLELVRSYELDDLIEQTRQAAKPCQNEWLFHPVDADYAKLSQQQSRPLRGYGFPLANGCVAVFLESREEAVLLTQQRDRWISDVAHELKTPLTSIRLVAETLQSRLEPPTRDWVERLLRETVRLSNLVQDLLDLNQLQGQSTARLKLKPVDLARLIQSVWVSLEPVARKKQIQLDYVGPEQLLIQADEARLHRVLLNLLDNSVKYSPTQQRIRIQLGLTSTEPASAQQVHLQIIDAGPGFPEGALPFVFDRFYRADPSRARNVAGVAGASTDSTINTTAPDLFQKSRSLEEPDVAQANSGNGLGLAIARQIVEAHQGTVIARNHPDTGGGWLQVFLPWHPLDPETSNLSM